MSKIRSQKYYKRIFAFITAGILLVVMFFALAVYINVEKIVLDNHFQTDRKLLGQMRHYIQNMDEIIKNLCLSIYFDPDVEYLLEQPDLDMLSVYRTVGKLRTSIVSTNPFVHSIYLYNGLEDVYYSTVDTVSYNEALLDEIQTVYGRLPKLKPILNREERSTSFLSGQAQKQSIFTYLMYQSSDGETIGSTDVDYAVILNVNADWLIKNIEVFNADEFSADDQIFIVDENNRLISKGDDTGDSKSLWPDILNAYLLDEDETAYNNFIYKGADNKDYIVTFISLDKPEWKLFKVQPSDEVFRYIDQMKSSVVLITLLFLAIAAIVSLYLSSVIYKPVGSLVKQVSKDHATHKQGRSTQDELKYLHEVYQLSSEQIEQYEAEKMTNSSIMKAYYLQNLMVRGALDVDDMLQAAEEYQLSVALHEPLALCYLRIDDFSRFEEYTYKDQALYRFAIANIMHELISRDFACEVVDSRREHIIMLFNPGSGTADYIKPLSEAIRLGQEYIGQYFQLSVSAAISDRVNSCEDVPKSLTQAQNLSSYRLIFGKKSIVHADLIKDNEKCTLYEHEPANEKKLAELIRTGNDEKIESLLADVFSSFQKMSYNNIMLSVHHIINTVRDTVFQMSQMRMDSVYIDFSILNDLMFKAETLDEIRECLSGFIRHTSQKESLEDKHLLLVQTMKNIVKSNYMDPGFSIQQIGDMMKMSPVYLGRVFKSVAQAPFTDYLNETRLNQAVVLMRETQNSINQIMIKVGIENESYFYRLFKKKFGSTPKDYLLKNTLNQYANQTIKDGQVE